MALGVVRAGGAARVVGALRLRRPVQPIDRPTAQARNLSQAIRQDRLGVGEQRRPRRLQDRPALRGGQRVRPGRAPQRGPLHLLGGQMQHDLHLLAQRWPALHMPRARKSAMLRTRKRWAEYRTVSSVSTAGCSSSPQTVSVVRFFMTESNRDASIGAS